MFQPLLVDLERTLRQLPRDGEAGASFPEMDARVGKRHLGTYLQVADEVASGVTSDGPRLSALAGNCAQAEALDRACVQSFARTFGARVFRRPLAEAELEVWTARALRSGDHRGAYRTLVAGFLASSEFWLRSSEARDMSAEGLTGHELAARLAVHFWRSAPDARLSEAAASGELARESGYRAQVERLSRHQRARATWYSFFRQWLRLDDFDGFAKDPAFERAAEGLEITPELYADAVWEIEELVGYHTFDTAGGYRELLTSDEIITRSRRLAALYGVQMWDGHSPPLEFPYRERSGLLTRAALLISGDHATNPFARGAFIRRQLLCEPIEPPAQRPPDAFVVPPFDPRATTRARLESKVSPVGCKSCHDLFTPYGYVLEAYDALGRYRTKERMIDDGGSVLGELPLDVGARVAFDAGRYADVRGPVELSEAIAGSPIAEKCLARQYFRFTFQRREASNDACTIEKLSAVLHERGLHALFRDIAFTDAFTRGAVTP